MNGKKCIEDGTVVMVDGEPEMHACRFWVVLQGKNPQDGASVNTGDCSFCWTPMLLIENSQMQRQTGAAVESFRNEMVGAQERSNQVLLEAAKISQGNFAAMQTIGSDG